MSLSTMSSSTSSLSSGEPFLLMAFFGRGGVSIDPGSLGLKTLAFLSFLKPFGFGAGGFGAFGVSTRVGRSWLLRLSSFSIGVLFSKPSALFGGGSF